MGDGDKGTQLQTEKGIRWQTNSPVQEASDKNC